MTAPVKLTDAMHLGSRLAAMDRADLEALLFSAVTRLAYLHETGAVAELNDLLSARERVEAEMKGMGS